MINIVKLSERGAVVHAYDAMGTLEGVYTHKGLPRIQNPELIDSFVNEVVLA
mgnify:CR=1 FL=1